MLTRPPSPREQGLGQKPASPFIEPGLTMNATADCPGGDPEPARSATTLARAEAQFASTRFELPLTLLSAGYHLRQINAVRIRFDGRAERVVLPVLLWLAARLADPDHHVAQAAAVALERLGLGTRPIPRSYSLREIADATNFPRETLRRIARQIEGVGWIMPNTAGQLGVTPQFTDYLWADGESERLQDFRWTAARIGELSDPATAPIGACITEALAAMSACRGDELPRSIHGTIPATLTGAPLAAALVYLCGYNRAAPGADRTLLQRRSAVGCTARGACPPQHRGFGTRCRQARRGPCHGREAQSAGRDPDDQSAARLQCLLISGLSGRPLRNDAAEIDPTVHPWLGRTRRKRALLGLAAYRR